MGKRVDFSVRSVITPDARLGIRFLGVPIKISILTRIRTVMTQVTSVVIVKTIITRRMVCICIITITSIVGVRIMGIPISFMAIGLIVSIKFIIVFRRMCFCRKII